MQTKTKVRTIIPFQPAICTLEVTSDGAVTCVNGHRKYKLPTLFSTQDIEETISLLKQKEKLFILLELLRNCSSLKEMQSCLRKNILTAFEYSPIIKAFLFKAGVNYSRDIKRNFVSVSGEIHRQTLDDLHYFTFVKDKQSYNVIDYGKMPRLV